MLAAGAALVSACGDDDGELRIPEGCNPLASDWDCLLPYPSDFHTTTDASLPGGQRVTFADVALPHTLGGNVATDVTKVHTFDGFAVLPPIMALFPFSVDDSNLIFHTGDVLASLGSESPTVLLDAETGERILHFAEMDPRATDDARRALLIRPMRPLRSGSRYIVAIRDLRDTSAKPIPPPEGFRRLRDGNAAGNAVLEALLARYESDVFAPLAEAQVDRAGLQLAWDFTTATAENATGDMLRVRELVMEALAATSPEVTVVPEDIQENVDEHIARRIEGVMQVPSYLEGAAPGDLLSRDASGQVVANGTREVPFIVLIPHSVLPGIETGSPGPANPGRLLQFGHGFFDGRFEADGSYMRRFANETGMVVIAVDTLGMSQEDKLPLIIDMQDRAWHTFAFTDRVHQAMADNIAVTYAARSTLQQVEALSHDGQLLYDPDPIYFYGISQGHITGGTYLALSPDIARGVLSSGGCSLSLIAFRSRHFNEFMLYLASVLPEPIDQLKFMALGQSSLDRVDSVAYAQYWLDNPLPGSPEQRRVLMQTGIGDPSVPSVSAHIHARALGLTHLQPSPRPIAGLEGLEGPFDGSAFVEFDFNLEEPVPGTHGELPTEDNGVHQAIRRLAPAISQIDAFLKTDGQVINFCDGACDPE